LSAVLNDRGWEDHFQLFSLKLDRAPLN